MAKVTITARVVHEGSGANARRKLRISVTNIEVNETMTIPIPGGTVTRKLMKGVPFFEDFALTGTDKGQISISAGAARCPVNLGTAS